MKLERKFARACMMSRELDREKQMPGIAFVLDGGFAGGGAERVAQRLIQYWVDQGRRVWVISTLGKEADLYEIPEAVTRMVLGGVKYSSNALQGFVNNIARVVRLRKALRRCSCRTIISFQTRTNVRTLVASVGLGRRVIVSERNDVSRQKFGVLWLALRRLFYRYATKVTANSAVALDSMRSYVPSEKLMFLPNPIVLPDQQAPVAKSRTILSVGRLMPQKNQLLILEALTLLDGMGKDWNVSILGEGPERPALLRRASDLAVLDRLTLHGWVSNPEPYYLSAAVFVLPSLYEGTPNALLEAMGYGIPCIVSDSLPGVSDLIDHGVTGMVFRSQDPDSLAVNLSALVNDKQLRMQLGAAGKRRLETIATSTRAMDEWDAIV